MKTILIATGNPHKQKKLKWIVEKYFTDILLPSDIDCNIEVEENGSTFLENAEIKAIAASKCFNGHTISTDAGITIPALGNDWNGLHTKRFAGSEATDEDRMKLLLSMLNGKTGSERKMVWNEAVAIAQNGKILFSQEVTGVEGVAQTDYDMNKYKLGIWLCSLWYFPQWQKNFFDLTEAETFEAEISWHKLKKSVNDYFCTADKT